MRYRSIVPHTGADLEGYLRHEGAPKSYIERLQSSFGRDSAGNLTASYSRGSYNYNIGRYDTTGTDYSRNAGDNVYSRDMETNNRNNAGSRAEMYRRGITPRDARQKLNSLLGEACSQRNGAGRK